MRTTRAFLLLSAVSLIAFTPAVTATHQDCGVPTVGNGVMAVWGPGSSCRGALVYTNGPGVCGGPHDAVVVFADEGGGKCATGVVIGN